ncbi:MULTISPECIES: hypothetical protein [unclassified Mesorhizobium]|uniref:hypothetical protein n=1 Tax=unclassified Mesorhizobium TaxID=325217 RepID=UPI001FEE2E3E|nr:MULTISPECIES: hypothetical protein [unclassified Mesorhizobium]
MKRAINAARKERTTNLEGWRSVAPPSVLPDISPTSGEIGSFGALLNPATLEIGESRREA